MSMGTGGIFGGPPDVASGFDPSLWAAMGNLSGLPGMENLAPTQALIKPELGGFNTPLSAAQVPGMGTGLGWNLPTAQLALTGLGTIGNLWAAFNAQKLAKKQFNFTKDVTNTNLNNQIKSYNTSLEDRVTTRAKVNGLSPEQAQAYLSQNKLTRTGG